MKKSKIITGLSATFVALIALASCNTIKANGHIVLKIGNEEYTAEDLFKDQRGASVGEAKFNAVYRVAVRKWAQTDGADGGKQYEDTIKKDTQNKISGQKDTAQSNANTNGTSYDTEWEKILKSNNVDDEQGLYDKFEYENQKTKFDDQFYENKLEILKQGGYLKNEKPSEKTEEKGYIDGYLGKKQPYHVKHILVKVSAAAGDPKTGEITEAEAVKLSTVVKELASGKNFGLVAKDHSDDKSKDTFGDLEIMDRDTSFVNEFKLGTYLYESYFGNITSVKSGDIDKYDSSVARDKLDLKTTTDGDKAGDYALKAAQLNDPSGTKTKITISGDTNETEVTGIGQIPYEAALMLGNEDYTIDGKKYPGYAHVEYKYKNGFSNVTRDDKAKYYPRNVIFNKYFNKNNIMVITPRRTTINTLTGTVGEVIKNYISEDGKTRTNDDQYKGIVNDSFKKDLSGFDQTAKNNDTLNISFADDASTPATSNDVLRDTNGRVIFVFRSGTTGDSSYQGIHFVCIERSPFVNKEYEGVKTEPVETKDYFTQYFPGQETDSTDPDKNYPQYSDKTDKPTYVNYISTYEKSDLKTRADNVKTKIKSANSNLNTYIYEYLVEKGDLKFKDGDELAQGIKNDINTWIERKRESTDYETTDTWNKTWKTYYQKLDESTKVRTPEYIASDKKYIGGTIAEACAYAYVHYDATNSSDLAKLQALFDQGGVFHD